MGDSEGFQRALDLLKPLTVFKSVKVQVFESTIRVMGGLLSCHSMATLKKFHLMLRYDGHCLALAKKLGDALLPAFKHTMPFARINLVTGVDYDESGSTCAAGVGTLLLEFGTLSRLTGDLRYETAATKALEMLWGMRSDKDLVAHYLDVLDKRWTNDKTSIGGGVDSLFEYMLKSHILFGESKLLDMFAKGYNAVQKHVANGILYGTSDLQGKRLNLVTESLAAFWPGMQVLIGDLEGAKRYHQYLFTIWRRYGLMPEAFDSSSKYILDSSYPLRPELFESTYYLFQATKNHYYLEVGASLLRDLDTMRVKCGFASIKDVFTGAKTDRMESFFLSETLKYLFLLFNVDHFLHRDDGNWVFSTEGHYMHIPLDKYSFDKPGSSFNPTCKHFAMPPSHLFGGGHIALPLPINDLLKINDMVALPIQQDHFFTHVIEPIDNGTYSGTLNDAFCYSRSFTHRINVTCFLKGLGGAAVGLEQVNDDWKITSINGTECVGYVYLDYESIKQYINGTVLYEPDLYQNTIVTGTDKFIVYSASFGPVIRFSATVSVTLSQLKTNKLTYGCKPSDYQHSTGTFAMIKRGECSFAEKAIVAQRMNATGLIIGNTQNKAFLMINAPDNTRDDFMIPVMLMPLHDALSFVKVVRKQAVVHFIAGSASGKATQIVNLMGKRVVNLRVVDGGVEGIREETRVAWTQ